MVPLEKFPDYAGRPSGKPLALQGLRVADFSRLLAGPFCTQTLGDLGAEVVKIESFTGDDCRAYVPPALAGEGAFYISTNRNKKSISLDLKHEAGKRIALDIIRGSDILVENFSNGVMDRLGFGYEDVKAINPGIIYCAVSAYGRDDKSVPARTGFDAMFQASSGFMSLTGEPGRHPMRTTVPVIDAATAMMATNAILGALVARERMGFGQYVEVALFDVAIAMLGFYGLMGIIGDTMPTRLGNRAPLSTPSDAYETSDGLIFLTAGNDRLFSRLAAEIGRPELASHPDFRENHLRSRNHAALTPVLAEVFSTQTTKYWVDKLGKAGIPIAPVNTIGQALESPDVMKRGIVSKIPHPAAGSVPTIRSPLRMGGTPVADPAPPPLLGQDTVAVLRDILGYDEEKLSAALASGAVKAGPAD